MRASSRAMTRQPSRSTSIRNGGRKCGGSATMRWASRYGRRPRLATSRHTFSKILSTLPCHSKCTRPLTFGNVCQAIRALIQAGVPVDHSGGDYQQTALHYAAREGRTEAVEALLACGISSRPCPQRAGAGRARPPCCAHSQDASERYISIICVYIAGAVCMCA